MGIIITWIPIAFVVIITILKLRELSRTQDSPDNITKEQIEASIATGGYNFEVIINLISEMSPKAQATFAYLYVQKVGKNKKLFGTIRRYMDMQATESSLEKPVFVKGKTL